MKVTIFLLVCCLAVIFDGVKSQQLDKYLDECKKELNFSEADASDPKKEACFLACMLKKQGQMRADGTLDLEFIINSYPKDADKVMLRKTAEEKNVECTNKAKGDACVLAACIGEERIIV